MDKLNSVLLFELNVNICLIFPQQVIGSRKNASVTPNENVRHFPCKRGWSPKNLNAKTKSALSKKLFFQNTY